MDYLNIGSVPYGEECVQTGSDDYERLQRIECIVFKHQLERMFPKGLFMIKTFPHDFGSYKEVVAYFDENSNSEVQKAAFDAAFETEANAPEYWDEQAKKELAELMKKAKS
jgi:hypothetical protein